MGFFSKKGRGQLKTRILIQGGPNSGKTVTALRLAVALAGDQEVAVIDTDGLGNARAYYGMWEIPEQIQTAEDFPDEDPRTFQKVLEELSRMGNIGAVVFDTFATAWGGTLQLADDSKMGKDKVSGWATARPAYRRLIDTINRVPFHVILCSRSHVELVKVGEGKDAKWVKHGVRPIGDKELEYEVHFVFRMDHEHTLHVEKSRIDALAEASFPAPGPELAQPLLEWATKGDAETRYAVLLSFYTGAKSGADIRQADARVVRDGGLLTDDEKERLRVARENARERLRAEGRS